MTLITADPPRPRPVTVTVAFWLQLAAVLTLLALLGLLVAHAVYYDGLISRAAELVPNVDPGEVSGERVGNVVTTAVPGVVVLVVVLWLAATALPMLRGSNVARIFVFVAGGAHLLLCASPFLAGAAMIPLFIASDPGYAPEDDLVWAEGSTFYDTLYNNTTPAEDAFMAGQAAVTVIEVVLLLAIVVLLAVPPASRWFVPPRPPVLPVGPYAVYPYAGYPYLVCPDPSVHLPQEPKA
ncbi:hypothetical protein SAMN05421812_11133 [Asanoa hainanensis]|uniref:Uncharacterized protein n=1 Tax=Asanoa hainanensis TaxID=560556 RepID=A0A239NW05_9ACTN|nr:hypothetical protein [Asanoa hainanensis]SNT58623.1 hypothetical protein SAMN05421812_11133 [Asanoa hainanensis]